MYLKAKKLHRFLVFIMSLLGLVMMLTGGVMKYPQLFSFIDPLAARRLHNTVSTFFSITLFLMATSGLTMYLYPAYQKRQLKKRSPTPVS